jgi:hypothetical protein
MYNCSMDRNHVFCQEGDPTTPANPVDIGPGLTRNAVERQLGAMNSRLYEPLSGEVDTGPFAVSDDRAK